MWSLKSKLIVGLILLASQRAFAQDDAIPWTANLDQAKAVASQNSKLILVHFWSTSCAPCMALEKYVFKNSDVGDAVAANYVAVKVNVTDAPELARQFNVRQIPTDIILDANGRELERRGSPGSVSGYVQMVNNAAQRSQFGQNPNQQLAQHIRESKGTQTDRFNVQQSQFQESTSNSFETNRDDRFQNQYNSFNTGNNFRNEIQPNRTAARDPWDGYNQKQGTPNNGAANGQPPANGNFSNQPPSQPTNVPPRSQMIYNNQFNNSNAPRDSRPPTSGNQFDQGNSRSFAGSPPAAQNPSSNQFAPGDRGGFNPNQNPTSNQFAPNNRPPFNPNPASNPQREFANSPPRQDIAPRVNPTPKKPTVGLEGYCPVSLLESRDPRQAWRKGDPRFGAIHRGKLYLFASQANQQKFLSSPDRYSPALSCFDPVKFVESSQLVEGRRRHGVSYKGQVFLFSDEGSLKTFWQNPSRYATIVQQAMNQGNNGNIRR